MSKEIKLSKKYGLNPTMLQCFWCGNETGEIALMGEVLDRHGREIEMPMHVCLNYDPCEECRRKMDSGFTLIEATTYDNGNSPIQDGVYPTGKWVVIKPEAAMRVFGKPYGKAFADPDVYRKLMG